MENGAGFKPITDNGERVPGMFISPGGRVVARKAMNVDGNITTKTFECYTRIDKDGEPIGLFEFPVERNVDSRTVSRKATGGESDLEEDLYIAKRVMNDDGTTRPVFRYSTPEDIIKLRALVKRNEAKAASEKAAQSPMSQQEALAKAITSGLASALASSSSQPKQTRMGAGNG